MENTLLSSSVTVAHYRRIEANDDRKAAGEFIKERFDERYLTPALDGAARHGFSMIAIACLTIEALQSFRLGLGSTKNNSGKMFAAFFAHHRAFEEFSDGSWFYDDIRCGILHVAEARAGWRILRRGPLVDKTARAINATRFAQQLRRAVYAYAAELEHDEALWILFKRKMNQVIKNCEA